MWEPSGPMGDGDSRECPTHVICWGKTSKKTRTGMAQTELLWLVLFPVGKERHFQRANILCQKWAPVRDELFLCPSGGCRSHLNNEFRGDTILYMAKVQAMNRALLCSNKCWRNVWFSQCCWMENEIVDFWAILPEMCKAAKIQNLFGNPQPSITQAIVK